VYEYGRYGGKFHAHIAIDFNDYSGSYEDLFQGVKKGIGVTVGIASKEFKLEPMYVTESGFNWINYILKEVDFTTMETVDFKNSRGLGEDEW